MGIKFKYDAAGVTPPSNQSTRKFGQQMVLGEQQRKYQGQQQGYDRLFQLGRDVQQNAFQVDRDNRIADFQQQQAVDQGLRQANRDKTLFDQQQKQQQAEQQFKFMEEARKQQSGMIMDDINNGLYDPVTARKLQQSIADEAEALGNPTLDATQRAEALKKIRAKRLLDSANRLEKPPPPTPDEEFQQSVATDPETGMRYRKNTKGDFEPLEQPKQDSQPQRFMSADEAFRADPKTRKDYMDQAIEMETNGGENVLTPELRKKAADTARRNYEEDYGIGTPTDAPELPGIAPAAPGQSRSILETGQLPAPGQPPAPSAPMARLPDRGMPPSPVASAYDKQMTGQGYQLITPTDGTKPYYYKDGSVVYPNADGSRSMSGPASVMNAGGNAPAAGSSTGSQNPWSEVANGSAPAASSMAAPQPASPSKPPATISPPDFTSLSKGASESDREELQSMQAVYSGLPQSGQQAMNVILSDSATKEQKAAANRALLQMGINLQEELSKRSRVKAGDFYTPMMS